MSSSLKFKVRGIETVQREVKMYEFAVRGKIRDLVMETAKKIRSEARRRAPKRTGGLRKGIVIHYNKPRTAAFVRASAPHSHLIEFGTARGLVGRPFMQPAAEANVSPYQQKLSQILMDV